MDPELEDFLHRAGFLLRRFVAVAPTVEEVEKAIEGGEEDLLRLLDLDPAAVRRQYRTLQLDAYRLLERNPVLEAEVEGLLRIGVPPCDTWELTQLARRLEEREPGQYFDGKEDRVVCAWMPYAAALVICTLTGNTIFYFACAAIAMCSNCSGGIVTTLCGG